jgi:hypothetical protein
MATSLTIEIYRDGQLVDTRSFQQSIIKIGRLASAHLRLDDPKVSRIHAVIEVSPAGEMSITDMGSAEGTQVGGERITKVTLEDGDEIVVGGTRLIVSQAEAEEAAATPPPPPPEAVETPAFDEDPATEVAVAPAEAAAPPPEATGTGGAAVAGAAAVAAGVAAAAAAPAPEAGTTAPAGGFAEVPAGAFQVPAEAPRFDAQGFIEGRVEPSPIPDADNRAIELRFMWGDITLNVAHFKQRKQVTVGESRKCDFFLSSEDFPVAEFPLVTWDSADYQLNVTPKMEGVVKVGEQICTLAEAAKARLATPHDSLDGAYGIRLTPDARAALQFGGVTVLVRSVTPSKPVVAPFGSQVNYNFLNTLLFSVFLHIALLITALNYPYDTRLMADDLFTTPNRFAKMILTPPDPPERNPLLDRLKSKDKAEAAEKHQKDEGQAGRKDMQDRKTVSAPKAVDPTDKQLVSQVFERLQGDSGLATVFDQSGLGGDLEGALGGLIGTQVGDSGGLGGLGLKGVGGGGGGLSTGTIGVGGIGTRGRAGGGADYGTGVAGLGPRSEADINISEGDPVIRGALDRELIRRVIHANRAAIRYCYERELQRTPGLHGRIAVRFTIAGNGTVTAANVDQNTMGNAAVADCLVSRLRTWQFPEPKGGGIVIVTYPFVFQQAG